MKPTISPWQSLQTRATLFTLAVFVLAIWALSFFVSRSLQADMERLLGEQQFSVVTAVAKEVDDNLTDRMTALETVAKEMDADLMASPAALQTRLEQRPLLQLLFNGGVWIAGLDGTAIADVPLSAQRLGVNYLSQNVIALALREGKASISAPILGKKRQLPVIGMAMPIRDAQGKVIGVLTGVTDLGKHSFLDQITQNTYGKTGGYFVIAVQHRLVVTATDKSRVMQALPAAGINPAIDRFASGYEGYAILVNAVGVSVLSSSKMVPAAGWAVAASLPTAEAFAPLHHRQQRLLWATLLLTLLTGALTWWILKRQLSPLLDTADAMRALAQANVAQPLPVTRQDEIGQLVQGFNQLLQNHQQREATLRASETFKNTVLNSLDAEIAVVDLGGVILAVNERWQQFALDNGLEPGRPAPNTGVGTNYLAVCGPVGNACAGDALDASAGLQAVLAGRLPSFTMDYPCDSPTQQRWFAMKIMPLGQGAVSGAVVTHTDITARKIADQQLASLQQQSHTWLEHSPVCSKILDLDFNLQYMSQAGVKQLNIDDVTAFYGRPYPFHFYPESFRQTMTQNLKKSKETGEIVKQEAAVVDIDGNQLWFHSTIIPMKAVDGRLDYMMVISVDITERKQAEEALRIAATAFEAQQGIVITDAQRMILRVNRAFTNITGYSDREAVGQYPRMLQSGRHDSAFYTAMTQALESDGAWAGEIWNRRKNGEIYPEWLSISAVKDGDGLTSHFVGIFNDISERINAQTQIDTLAFYDPLTQLPNRRLLLDRLEQARHISARHARNSALLFVDLDNFKTLNDTLGHHQGDLLLAQVAQRLKTCIREGDTVARLGSDEFVVMLENLSEDDMEAATQAETVADNILQAFQQDFSLDQGSHHATPSIGITLFGGDSLQSSEQPLRHAELAMFQAKAAGRNTLRFFDARMQAEVSAHAALEADLREAVAQQQFLLHYQPQVVGAGRITGVEALVRWQHPRRGMVSPAEFIPLAEESGLILPIGQWVLEAACAQLTAWAQQPDLAHLTVAVNVSARQFKQENFVDNVLATLARTQANPKRLKLELTESMLVEDVEAIIAKMGLLKAHGVAFSLDDFGTGYSSLAYLKRLPLDQLKIDQGFVRNIVTDPNDAVIAKMVVLLAESMGLSVIAEGVELQAQAEFLAHQGCHAYQGYLFSRPLPLAALEAFAMQNLPQTLVNKG